MNNPIRQTLRRLWVVFVAVSVFVGLSAQTVGHSIEVEYFFDEDPGMGKATHTEVTMDANGNITFSPPTTGLSEGNHTLGMRAWWSTAEGVTRFSPTIVRNIVIPVLLNASTLQYAEYFFDEDPGYGQGYPILLQTDGHSASLNNISLSTEGIAAGNHTMGVRMYSTQGWSPTIIHPIAIPEVRDANVTITYGEYFWDEDPGYGNGSPIALVEGKSLNLQDLSIPSGDANGDAKLHIRFFGTSGWSPTLSYLVMVDAEGNYTLDATKETNDVARNYQSIDAMVNDFAQRTVGDDIIVTIPTTNTDYSLDLTVEGQIDKIAAIASSIDEVSTLNSLKTVGFKAQAGSGNTISVIAADEDMPTVIDFFSHTWTENVSLTINGVAYDFSPLNIRYEELCYDGETTPVSLSSISQVLTATWTAQPHEGTTLSGYAENGTGDLPAMTITNSGTQKDYLAYAVTIRNSEGTPLLNYTYNIDVHARVSTQTFTQLTPAIDSCLDPGSAKLTWNAISDAVGKYRLDISSLPLDAEEGTTPQAVSINTDATSYVLTTEAGRSYTWTVTAIGFCDELVSPAMTFTTRRLPDLVVSSINCPDAADAGNTLTVTATITNMGDGSTTEAKWTDRLFYTIDSENFADAVQMADLVHKQTLPAGGTYNAVFNITVPEVESGWLRFFVVSDVTSAVLESNDENNRAVSAAAELNPFYVNANDLIVLRNLYNTLGGENWNGTAWQVESNLIRKNYWSGITFDSEGCVKAINLQGCGLTGTLSTESAITLPHLQSLNLSRNALTGDPASFVAGCTALTSLNLSYNQIDELSAMLSTTITSLDLSYQHRIYNNKTDYPGIEVFTPQTLTIGQNTILELPAIATYDHQKQSLTEHPTLAIYDITGKTKYGTLVWSEVGEAYIYQRYNWLLSAWQDEAVTIRPSASAYPTYESVYPAQMHFIMGDANLTGWVDVNDVQRTLNYVLGLNAAETTSNRPSNNFSLAAANTYSEEEEEGTFLINIQDIVCTVNIVLTNEEDENPSNNAKMRRIHRVTATPEEAPNAICVNKQTVQLCSTDEVAAFDIELEGITASQVKLLLPARQFSMQTRNTQNGTRLVVFSPTGETIPAGTTDLLRISGNASLVAVQASSPLAESLDIMIRENEATDIEEISNDASQADDGEYYNLNGQRVDAPTNGIYIRDGKKVYIK